MEYGDLSVTMDGAQKKVLLHASNWVTPHTHPIATITVLPMISGLMM